MPTLLARLPGQLQKHKQGEGEQATETPTSKVADGVTGFIPAPDGSKIFVTTPEAVDVYDAASGNKLRSIPEKGVVFTALSPLANYVVTCQKPMKNQETGEPAKNLKVWEVASGNVIVSHTLRQVSKDSWPFVQWEADEAALAFVTTNTLQVYSKENNFASYRKVSIKGIASCAICPSKHYGSLVAAFIPESKGGPASAGIYDYSKPEPNAYTRKGFFRTQGANLKWNSKGSALLVQSYSDFDATNQSYYGEQKLHFMLADPAKADAATTVSLPKEGPVHDFQWSPNGDFFVTVAGFMPAKSTLWDANCRPIYDFGSGPFSMVRWNPFSRFLSLMGFGNLPGDIVLWDKKANNSCKQMGATRCPAVCAEWSPDGRSLLVATTSPRLRVDNSFKVISYYGEQVARVNFDVLLEATWLPASPGTYPDRPQSPERLAAAASAGPNKPATTGLAPKPAGYVPPHLRNADGGPKLAPPSFSLGFDGSDRGGKIGAAQIGVLQSNITRRPREVPGFEFVENKSSASKNAKKRANAKKKKEEEEGGQPSSATQPASTSGGASEAADGVAGMSLEGEQKQEEGSEAQQKKIRNLQKKIRQIGQLKEKRDQTGGAGMEGEQLAKIAFEGALLQELHALGGSM